MNYLCMYEWLKERGITHEQMEQKTTKLIQCSEKWALRLKDSHWSFLSNKLLDELWKDIKSNVKYYAIIGHYSGEIIGACTDEYSDDILGEIREEEPNATLKEISKEEYEKRWG